MGRIKILYIIGSYGVGGKERQLAELIKSLPKNRYSVMFIIKNGEAHFLQNIENEVDFFYSLEEKRFGLKSLIKIRRKINDFNPDIVHSWASVATLQVILIKLFLNFKLIDGSIRDSIEPGINTRIIRLLINLFADRIIANSKAGLLCHNISERKGTYIHNGFDFERINNLEPPIIIKDKFRINASKIVGMIARIDFEKDYPTFIKAAKIILLIRSDVKFIIVGDGLDKDKIQSMITSEQKDKFIFTGQQSCVESIINCFDVAVLATFKEGISNSIIEYMALEKPVVATDGGGTSELVLDGVTGFLVRAGDEEQLAEKIQFILDHPDYCISMGTEGKKRITSHFNIKKMACRFQVEYENILNRHS